MRFKLDENLGWHAARPLIDAGHDVATVRDQALGGATDADLFEVCAAEKRVLVTPDRDFGQVLRFPPEHGPGVVILEPGGRVSPGALLDRMRELLEILRSHDPAGALWIVEPGRVRMHERRDQS